MRIHAIEIFSKLAMQYRDTNFVFQKPNVKHTEG